MTTATVVRVDATCAAFARRHGLAVPGAGDTLELADAVGSGGFGAVHPVDAVGGTAPASALLAKLFDAGALSDGGGPDVVIGSMRDLHDALEHSGDPDWPDAVLALPYTLLTARVGGQQRLVALMLDLRARGYEPAPLADDGALAAYRKESLDVRLAYALRLAERALLLNNIGFLHADLNPQNLLVHRANGDVQVIDFDAGVVVRTGAERPRTAGKPDDCMPPDIKDPSAPGGADTGRYTLAAERWSWTSLIGLFLFSVHPAFFLREISPTCVEAYAKAPERWPDIDTTGPLFTAVDANRLVYAQIRPIFLAVPAEVVELLADHFDAGLDADARPDAAAWVAALSGTCGPPALEVKLLSENLVLEGEDVVVAWRAPNATHVEVVPGGRRPASGSVTFPATEHVRVAVTAFNAFGSETVRAPVVRVMPLPRIERVVVPASAPLTAVTAPALGPVPGRPSPGGAPAPPRLAVPAPLRRASTSSPLPRFVSSAGPRRLTAPIPGFTRRLRRS